MWKVFGYAFYSGVKCDDERSLALKCYLYERSNLPAVETPSDFETGYVSFAESIIAQGV
jgi:hypothetical protein